MASQKVLAAAKAHAVPYMVHISSSVVNRKLPETPSFAAAMRVISVAQ